MNKKSEYSWKDLLLASSLDFKITRGEIHLWTCHLSAFQGIRDQAPNLLSEYECRRANFYLRPNDRNRFILGRMLTRIVLGALTKKHPSSVSLIVNKLGRPVLVSDKSSINFSISHSGNYVAVGITEGAQIGLDIQLVRKDIDFRLIVEKYFSHYERIEIFKLPDDQQNRAFFSTWCKKEAFVKAQSLGVFYPFNDFSVPINPNHHSTKGSKHLKTNKINPWQIDEIEIATDYAGAIATNLINQKIRSWIVTS